MPFWNGGEHVRDLSGLPVEVRRREYVFAGSFRFRVAGFIAVRTQELVSQFEPFFDFGPSRNLVKCIPGMLISMNQLSQINGTPGA